MKQGRKKKPVTDKTPKKVIKMRETSAKRYKKKKEAMNYYF